MGSLRTLDSYWFSRNLTILAPSIHGSPLVYFHRTPQGEYLGDNGREVSSCCYHAHVSKKIKRRSNWERKDHSLGWRYKGEPFQLTGKMGDLYPYISSSLSTLILITHRCTTNLYVWIYPFNYTQVFFFSLLSLLLSLSTTQLSRCQYSEKPDTCFTSFIPFIPFTIESLLVSF